MSVKNIAAPLPLFFQPPKKNIDRVLLRLAGVAPADTLLSHKLHRALFSSAGKK